MNTVQKNLWARGLFQRALDAHAELEKAWLPYQRQEALLKLGCRITLYEERERFLHTN